MTHINTSGAAPAALLAAAALLLTCAAPARAAAEREPAADWLLLGVTRGDARSGLHPTDRPDAHTGTTRGALLLCDPPSGHARAARACADLDAADGRIEAIPPQDAPCPMVHAPVTAHARGQWRGQPVEYTRTFPNRCVLEVSTGAVFAWDGGR
ncbi:SSI family serine proteinase inhibitor [Streptomyces ziwulingensis]